MRVQSSVKIDTADPVLPLVDAVARKKNLDLQEAITQARDALLKEQRLDGHWVYDLEADCTIPAEYVMMMHFMDEVDTSLEQKIAVYLRQRQMEDGGWPLYHGGEFDISCSVKSYYALKLVGDDPNAPHMARARDAIRAYGGAARSNVFTRIALALFEQVPWRAVPFIPVEIMYLPRWFFFHLSKVSYWSRTVMVPLFILCSLKPKAANPRKVDIRELFVTPPEEEQHYFKATTLLSRVFLLLDQIGRRFEPFIPKRLRQNAVQKALDWFIPRLNGEDGLGGIFPAMVNAYEALALTGYGKEHPLRVTCKASIDKLLVVKEDLAYCTPCLSPVWDTGLACLALDAVADNTTDAIIRGLDWLRDCQLKDEPGDWQENHPGLPGGGWAFQYNNAYYPDLDDTSMVGWLMCIANRERYQESIERAAIWIAGMQSKNGGFGSFDADNTHYYLNYIPFADHGALLDPPTADVTGRCIAFLSLTDKKKYKAHLERAFAYIKRDQEADGSWFGRWGTNYIYGTWSVLTALELAGEDMRSPYVQRAVAWLKGRQHIDGGWGESNDSYYPEKRNRPYPSTSFQTAWALLALMAAGEHESDAVRRGINYLLKHQQKTGLWSDESFTAPGFPRVFYLKYHGYDRYFPLWALAQYRKLTQTRDV